LDFGLRRNYKWKFIVAKVTTPIIGADFLAHHNLLVDLKSGKLIDNTTRLEVNGLVKNQSHHSIVSIPLNFGYSEILRNFPNLLRPFPPIAKSTEDIKHYIETKGPPVSSKARRLPSDKYTKVKEIFRSMMEEGICQPSKSPWASPLHIVYKKDGSMRPCGDYRRLNNQTLPDRYGVPNLLDFGNQLKGTTIYSTLDINRAYHHIPVASEDIPKTAIITPFGLFEFKRMTFGLRNAAQTFQRFMDHIFRDMDFVFVYLDDILIASRDEEIHQEHLRKVLERLEYHRLTLKLTKCVLGKDTVTFLGYEVSRNGIKPTREKVKTILELPRPKTIRELRSFLGMLNFYRRSLNKAAEIQRPLNQLLKGAKKNDRTPIEWTRPVIESFEESKKELAKTTGLAHPDESLELSLACDASEIGIGAVLQQKKDNEYQPLGFFSRALSTSQRKYSTYDRELLAIFEAVRYFRNQLEGRIFHIITDHKPLTHALAKSNQTACPRRLRQLNLISQFTSDIRYLPGKDNNVADTLSRIEEICIPEQFEELANAQKDDPNILQLKRNPSLNLEEKTLPGTDVTILCETSTGTPRPYLPQDLRKPVFARLHNLGHPGIKATRKLIRARFFWPNMNIEVGRWTRSCISCQRAKVHKHTSTPFGIIKESGRLEHIHLDIIGPLPPSEGKTYCLTIIDRGTHWPEVIPIRNIEAKTIAKRFYETWIARFGIPLRLTTDQGRQFESQLFQELTQILGIAKIRTTPYHPQANGKIERFHRTLKTALTAHGTETGWTKTLPTVLLGLRTAVRADEEKSTAELLYGQTLRLPGEFFMEGKHSPIVMDDTLSSLRNSMKSIRQNNKVFISKDLHNTTHVFSQSVSR